MSSRKSKYSGAKWTRKQGAVTGTASRAGALIVRAFIFSSAFYAAVTIRDPRRAALEEERGLC